MYLHSHCRYKEALLKDADVFGYAMFGDGATVKRMLLVNVLVSTPNEPCAVLDIVDCSEHMNSGGKKDATYLADQFVDKIEELDPLHNRLDVIIFDGASNVQKSG